MFFDSHSRISWLHKKGPDSLPAVFSSSMIILFHIFLWGWTTLLISEHWPLVWACACTAFFRNSIELKVFSLHLILFEVEIGAYFLSMEMRI